MQQQENVDVLNEQVSVRLPRGAWNTIVSIIWKSATCEVGNPLLEALRSQLQPDIAAARNGRED